LIKPDVPANLREQLLWERELLGLYITQHPLELFEAFLSEKTVPLSSLRPEHDNRSVTIGGAVTNVRDITTKNGQKMAFIKLQDQSGEIEIILFPSAYQQTVGLWDLDRVVLVQGKINARDKDGNQTQEIKVTVDDAREVTHEQASAYQATGKKAKLPNASKAKPVKKATESVKSSLAPERLYIRLSNSNDENVLISLKEAIDMHSGSTEVVLVLGEAAGRQAIKLPGGIDRGSDGLAVLTELVGAENIKLQ
jgi:DNA polymerase-3 subunit alpha